jgi:hypothetical protein
MGTIMMMTITVMIMMMTMVPFSLCRATTEMPWDMQDDELDLIVADPRVLAQGLKKREKLLGRLLYRFVNNPAAQMALVSAFGIAHRFEHRLGLFGVCRSSSRPVCGSVHTSSAASSMIP